MVRQNQTVLIALDWGTTSLRAYRLGPGAEVLDSFASSDGILSAVTQGFPETLRSAVGDWLNREPGVPVLASGMITSRNGWLETAYLRTPASVSELAGSLTPVAVDDITTLHFVTGLSHEDSSGVPDIMRGEETQIVGCLAADTAAPGEVRDFLMPGTHSKWVQVVDGRIARFKTYMTGEVYAVLKDHSILGRLMQPTGPEITPGFRRGVSARMEASGSLLHQIFSARTLAVFDHLAESQVADYLSGLLIGEEVRAALAESNYGFASGVIVVGRGDLSSRYAAALEEAGVVSTLAPDDVTARGQYAIAKAGGLLP